VASPERVGGGTDAGDREAAGSAEESTADPAAERVFLEDTRNCSSLILQTSLVSWSN
jgi:hypothetical protein